MEQALSPHRPDAGAATLSHGLRVLLLGRFEVGGSEAPLELAPGSQRLLAYVALAGGAVRRDFVAGVLWPDVSERGAHVSLRAALARLRACTGLLVRADAHDVRLVAGVGVDLHEAQPLARRLLGGEPVGAREAAAARPALSLELLPGWYEDWVLVEAENWRQLRLHALEAASRVLADVGRFGEAVAAGRAAVSADPLRESPRAALIEVHLREGNQSEALREFALYREQLGEELGLEPTERLRALLPS